MSRQVIDSEGNKRFDSRVHIRDAKSGRIVRTQPYSLKCIGDAQIFVCKVTGKKYTPDGELIHDPALEQSVKKPAAPAQKPGKPAPAAPQGKSAAQKPADQAPPAGPEANLPPAGEANPEPQLNDPNHPSAQAQGL